MATKYAVRRDYCPLCFTINPALRIKTWLIYDHRQRVIGCNPDWGNAYRQARQRATRTIP